MLAALPDVERGTATPARHHPTARARTRRLERALPAERVLAVAEELRSLLDRIVAMTVAEYGRGTGDPG